MALISAGIGYEIGGVVVPAIATTIFEWRHRN